MFNLAAVDGDGRTLSRLAATAAPSDRDLDALEAPDSSDDDFAGPGEIDGDEEDEGDEALRYEMELEDALDRSYQGYLERKGVRDDVRKVCVRDCHACCWHMLAIVAVLAWGGGVKCS
jgi:hypothetical protein